MPTAKDERALLEDIKTRLDTLTWPGGGRIFSTSGSLIISAARPDDLLDRKISPICQISPLASTSDAQIRALKTISFGVALIVVNRNDNTGEAAMMGDSDEQGILQLSRLVELSIQSVSRDVVPISVGSSSSGNIRRDDWVAAYREMRYQALVSSEVE